MTDLPRTSNPASQAFELAGIRSLEDLARWTERDLAALHGVGPKVIRILRAALTERGLHFAAPR